MGKAYILLAELVAFVLKSGIKAIPQSAQTAFWPNDLILVVLSQKSGMFALMDNFLVLNKFATYALLWWK